MKRTIVAVGVLAVMCAVTDARAQEDLKKVAGWNGEWKLELWGKDSKDGKEWATTGKGAQHQIGDFCVWRSDWKSPDGKDASDLGVTGYDPAKKKYFGVGFRNDGFQETSVVTFGEGTVVYDVTGTTNAGETVRTRCTWTVPKDAYEGKCETLTDGEWWVSGKEKGVRIK